MKGYKFFIECITYYTILGGGHTGHAPLRTKISIQSIRLEACFHHHIWSSQPKKIHNGGEYNAISCY